MCVIGASLIDSNALLCFICCRTCTIYSVVSLVFAPHIVKTQAFCFRCGREAEMQIEKPRSCDGVRYNIDQTRGASTDDPVPIERSSARVKQKANADRVPSSEKNGAWCQKRGIDVSAKTSGRSWKDITIFAYTINYTIYSAFFCIFLPHIVKNKRFRKAKEENKKTESGKAVRK